MIIVRLGEQIKTYDELMELAPYEPIYFKSKILEVLETRAYYDIVVPAAAKRYIEHGFLYRAETEVVLEDEETDESTMNTWISVNGRTPEDDRIVLILIKYNNFKRTVSTGSYIKEINYWNTQSHYDVTHWMEIPEFPEDTEDER